MELAKDLSAKYQEILTLEIQVVVDNSKDVVFIFVRKPARAGPHLHTLQHVAMKFRARLRIWARDPQIEPQAE